MVRKQPWWRIAAGLVVLAAGFYFLKGGSKSAPNGSTFTARRGPLDITVLEGGSLQALESQEAKCEVRVGYQGLKILKIVEEGYLVTDDDIKTNKVLVELDSSDLRKQITQQDITFESTAATLVDAQQAYDIQLNQNLSDVKAAEQKAKFARMDFEKFLGDKATTTIIKELGIDDEKMPERTNTVPKIDQPMSASGASADSAPASESKGGVGSTGDAKTFSEIKLAAVEIPLPAAPARASATPQPEAIPAVPPPAEKSPGPAPVLKKVEIDFAKYADTNILGDGEAKQKIRKLQDDHQVAQKEYNQARTSLDGSKRLQERGFITKTELENEELKLENSRLKVQTAETARALFMKYEFPKSAEEFLSKYAEAVRELDRARKGAVAKLAQAEAKLKSAEGRYNLEMRQRKELYEQVDKCLIRAKKQGLVVYGGGGDEMYYYGGQEQIREGATVRERQSIITIPDLTKMSVRVKIHESYIKKIQKGQKVRIKVDAFPDKEMEGEVTKVGVLPDSQNRWMNPDLKVYLTTITIKGVHDWIKPGMSAKTEILVKQLPDVVYVPIQTVTPVEGKQICYVAKGEDQERREVEVGDFNDEFIEIKKGIAAGELVCLKAPEGAEQENSEKSNGDDKTKKPAEPAKPKAVSLPIEPPAKAKAGG